MPFYEGMPADEREELARHIIAQGDEAGFSAEEIAEARSAVPTPAQAEAVAAFACDLTTEASPCVGRIRVPVSEDSLERGVAPEAVPDEVKGMAPRIKETRMLYDSNIHPFQYDALLVPDYDLVAAALGDNMPGLEGMGADDGLTPVLWEQVGMSLDAHYDPAGDGWHFTVDELRVRVAARVARAILAVHGLDDATVEGS